MEHQFSGIAHCLLALKGFIDKIKGQDILVYTDNICIKAHLSCQGGTRSKSLQNLACSLFMWVERQVLLIRAEYFPGVENIMADWLNRKEVDKTAW